MIDWHLVVFGGLWIAGLSLTLATVGMARYAAGEQKGGLRDLLDTPRFQISLNAGMILFCLGLLGSAAPLWEQVVWSVLALLFAVQIFMIWRQKYAK